MSGDLNITSGGAVSVDSEAFRAIGDRLSRAADTVRDAGEKARRASRLLALRPSLPGLIDPWEIGACGDRLERIADEMRQDAAGMRMMADVFELVELRAEQEALRIARPEEALELQDRIDALVRSDPAVEDRATMLVDAWKDHRFDGLLEQPIDRVLMATGLTGGLLLPSILGIALAARPGGSVRNAVLPTGTALTGPRPPVTVEMTSRSVVGGAPRDLTQALQRLPKDDPQIRIEKMTYRDGSTRYLAYLDGTRTVLPGTQQPWDMGSNWDVYMDRERSASSEATRKALELAGARPGDRVDVVGYSQAGMIVDHLAMSGVYDTGLVVTVGDPTQASLAPDQMLVELRHTDDPIGSGLSGGGSAGGTGSPDSFSVTREAAHGLAESSLSAHSFDEYLETARLADASGDVRVGKLREYLAGLDQAVRVERMDFTATRP